MPELFWEIHSDLPREGPGDDASTRRAFEMLPGLPDRPRILDLGCGPGMQTLALARLSGAEILALDTHQPFLADLERRAAAAGLAAQIKTLNASMDNPPCEPGSVDLIWSEGAIYIIGFEAGLRRWRPLLRPGGCVAVTELSWIRPDPPEPARAFWAENYPGMQSVAQNLASAQAAGYTLLGHFTIPESAWLEGYYLPIEQKLASLRQKYADLPDVQRQLDAEQTEVDLYRQYSAWYGYEFYVLANR